MSIVTKSNRLDNYCQGQQNVKSLGQVGTHQHFQGSWGAKILQFLHIKWDIISMLTMESFNKYKCSNASSVSLNLQENNDSAEVKRSKVHISSSYLYIYLPPTCTMNYKEWRSVRIEMDQEQKRLNVVQYKNQTKSPQLRIAHPELLK